MMRWLIVWLLIFGCQMSIAEGATADGKVVDSLVRAEMLDSLGVDTLNQEIQEVNRELALDLSPLTLETVKKVMTMGSDLSPQAVVQAVQTMLFHEIAVQLELLGQIIFLAMLCVLMQQLHSSFQQSEIALLSYSVCFIFLLTLGMKAFSAAVILTERTIEAMITIMEALLPMLLFLLTTVGAITGAALFTPMVLFAVNALGMVMKNVILPLFLLVAVLDSLNYFSTTYRVGQLAMLLRQVGMVAFALGMTLFTGLMAVQGISASVADGLGLRTAKFAVGNLVPIVGKLFADSVDVVFGASLILKNAIGIFGIVTIATICLLPLIKLLVLSFLMKASGALIQPMGESKLSACLSQWGTNIFFLFAVLLAVALLFFLTITMIVGMGMVSVMMR